MCKTCGINKRWLEEKQHGVRFRDLQTSGRRLMDDVGDSSMCRFSG